MVGLFGGVAPVVAAAHPDEGGLHHRQLHRQPRRDARVARPRAHGRGPPIPIRTRPLSEATETLEDLKAGRIVGRVVLTP